MLLLAPCMQLRLTPSPFCIQLCHTFAISRWHQQKLQPAPSAGGGITSTSRCHRWHSHSTIHSTQISGHRQHDQRAVRTISSHHQHKELFGLRQPPATSRQPPATKSSNSSSSSVHTRHSQCRSWERLAANSRTAALGVRRPIHFVRPVIFFLSRISSRSMCTGQLLYQRLFQIRSAGNKQANIRTKINKHHDEHSTGRHAKNDKR